MNLEPKPAWQQWLEKAVASSTQGSVVNVPVEALDLLVRTHQNGEDWIQKQQAALVASANEKTDLLKRMQKMGEQLDALLNHCPDAECSECAKIICPHGEPFHFHHDGCPACSDEIGDDDPTYAPAP